MFIFCSFSDFFVDFRREITEKGLKLTKRLKTAEKSSLTSFLVRLAPKSWLKYTTIQIWRRILLDSVKYSSMQNLKKSSHVCSTHFGPDQLLIKWGLKQRASVYQNFVVLVFSSPSKTDLKIRPPHSVNLISSKFQILVNGINFSNYVEVLYICFFMIIDQIITFTVTC